MSARWTRDNQPKGLKSAAELANTLRDYEAAKAALEPAGKARDANHALNAPEEVKKPVKAVLAETSKAKGKPEREAATDCLPTFDVGGVQQVKWIDEHTAGSDGSALAAPEAYQDCLVAALKRLRSSGEMNVGLVLGKTAEDHPLVLHRRIAARTLAMTLVKETDIQQMTCDTARPAKDKAGVLVLTLEGKQFPGMSKTATSYRRNSRRYLATK